MAKPVILPSVAPRPPCRTVFTRSLQSFSRDSRSFVYSTVVSFIHSLQGLKQKRSHRNATDTLCIKKRFPTFFSVTWTVTNETKMGKRNMSNRKGFLRPEKKSSTTESSFSLRVVCHTTDWRSEFGLFLIYLPVAAPLPPSIVFCPSLQTFITLTNLPLFFTFLNDPFIRRLLVSPSLLPPFIPPPFCPPVAALLMPFLWPVSSASAYRPLV